MEKILNNVKKLFFYNTQKKVHDFSLSEKSFKKTVNSVNASIPNSISTSLDTNLSNLKLRYSSKINSDVVLRDFKICVPGKSYKALIVFIDGMIDSNLVNNFLLRPLMQTNKNIGKKTININGIQFNKNININLEKNIRDKLIPQNNLKIINNLDEAISGINTGSCALFVDSLNLAFLVDVKGYKAREISSPSNEVVVRGSGEAFVEKLRTNTTMLRRIINNENLIFEEVNVGCISKTNVAICYLKNIVNSDLVKEVKFRLKNLDIDYIVSSRAIRTIYSR